MKDQRTQLAKHIFLTGSFIAGSVLGLGAATTTSAESLFGFRSLGSGADLRSSLLESSSERNLELKCGSKTETSTSSKTADAKCGNKTESKTKDAKCGEGKCGGKSESKTKDANCGAKKDSTVTTTQSKTKDAKCGEGKCGGKKSSKKETTTPPKK